LARQQDVFLLTALGSSGQKDDERIPIMAEINPVAWPKVEAQRETLELSGLTPDVFPSPSRIIA
jgi:hypothetical protein